MVALILCFLLGIGNFAAHKAVLESGHPFVRDAKYYFGRHFGQNTSYILEFVALSAAMIFAFAGSTIVLIAYLTYSLANMIAAWLLLSGRV